MPPKTLGTGKSKSNSTDTISSKEGGSRNKFGTINNPSGALEIPNNAPIKRVVWQLEQGKQGTPHFQFYIELTKPMRYTAIKKWGGNWTKAAQLEKKKRFFSFFFPSFKLVFFLYF